MNKLRRIGSNQVALIILLIILIGCGIIFGTLFYNEFKDKNLPNDIVGMDIDEGYSILVYFENGQEKNIGRLNSDLFNKPTDIESVYICEQGNLIVRHKNKEETIVGSIAGFNDGRVELKVEDNAIQWKYTNSDSWQQLVSLSLLTGAAGTNGADGKEIEISLNETHIVWRYVGEDESSYKNIIAISTITGQKGEKGEAARNVEFQMANAAIEWKYTDGDQWATLIPLADITGRDGADGREVEFDVNNGNIVWRYADEDDNKNRIIVPIASITGADGVSITDATINDDGELVLTLSNGNTINAGVVKGKDGIDGREVEFDIDNNHIVWRYIGETDWNVLIDLDLLKGAAGLDGFDGADGAPGSDGTAGREVEFDIDNNHIVWRYDCETDWNELIDLDLLKGKDGINGAAGADGTDGADGISITDATINNDGELVLTLSNGNTINAGVVRGKDGTDGREVEFAVVDGFIVWRYIGETNWNELIDLDLLKGAAGLDGSDGAPGSDGKKVVFNVSETHIQYKYEDEQEFTNLIKLADLRGADGIDGIAGADGADGADGVSITDATINNDGELVLTLSNGNTINAGVVKGKDGTDGREVEFAVVDGFIVWRYVGEDDWTRLIDLDLLKGAAGLDGSDGASGSDGTDGREVEFNIDNNHIVWRYDGETDWNELIDLDQLKGTAGVDGAAGKSAYEIYLDYYSYTGSEEDWINDLINGNLSTKPDEFDVVFYDYNGYIISHQKVGYDLPADSPDNPVREGYTFEGWDQDYSEVRSNLAIYPIYVINKYTINYYSEYSEIEQVPLSQVTGIEHNSCVELADAPTREGYTFVGWFTGDNYNDQQYFDTTLITSNVNLYGRWEQIEYDVIFYDYNGYIISLQKVVYGQPANSPNDPKREGYDFEGWDKDYSQIVSNLEIYPIYSISKYTISFFEHYGTSLLYDTLEGIEHNSCIELTDSPTREGYTFVGWFTGDNYNDQQYFDTTLITSNVNLYGRWEQIEYDVIFYDYNGYIISHQKVTYNQPADNPDDPEREGYNFKGWDKDYSQIVSNLEIYPVYEIKTYTVKYYIGREGLGTPISLAGGAYDHENVAHNSCVNHPNESDLTKDGHTFAGWYEGWLFNTNSLQYTDSTPITKNLALYAKWEPINLTITILDYQDNIYTILIVPYGSRTGTLNIPKPPKPGHSFLMWNPSLPTIIAQSIVLRPTYSLIYYTVSFDSDGGSPVSSITTYYQGSITMPPAPTKPGFDFEYWYVEGSVPFVALNPNESFYFNYTQNIEFKAKWKDNSGGSQQDGK